MPKFHYKAIDAAGRIRRGTLVTLSAEDVEGALSQNGLTLIKSRPVREGIGGRIASAGSIKPRIQIEFYHRLAQTLDMGLPILSALEENAKILPSKFFSRVITEVKIAIEGGRTLFEAMSRYPKVFDKLDLAIIHMGEQTGVLPQSIKNLAAFLEWKEDIRATIKRATIYPSFVILVIVAVIGVWAGYVLPQMAGLLSEMGVPLPDITRIILTASFLLRAQWPFLLAGVAAAAGALYLFQRTPGGGVLVHRLWLKVPIIGDIVRNIAIARLSHNFATMYQSGITINAIFDILSENVLGNRYLELQVKHAYREIERGQSIAAGFESSKAFPPLLLGAIRNGETTGTLDTAFHRLGDYYDGEVKRSVQALVNAMEPLTTILLGGVFAAIVLSIMLPLYDVIGAFK